MAPPSGLSWWLDQIGRIPLLTPAEEIELGNQVQAWLNHPGFPDSCPPGIKRRGKRAKDRFVKGNLRLAVAYVSKHCHRMAKDHSIDDLVQAANEGLIRAVERFDPTRGYRFSTYAYWWIRQAVGHWADHHTRLVAIPGSHSQHLGKLGPIRRRLAMELGREPTQDEIAAELGVSERVMDQLLVNARPVASLDQVISDDGLELGDVVACWDSTPEEYEAQDERYQQAEQLRELMATLPSRDQMLLAMAWGLDGPAVERSEIATQLGMKPARVDGRLRYLQQQLQAMQMIRDVVPSKRPVIRPVEPMGVTEQLSLFAA
jgi:RNA polymerase primary sigma factor